MKRILFFLLFLLPVTFSFSSHDEPSTCTCEGVSNIQKTDQTSSSVSFSWTISSEYDQIRLWYVPEGGSGSQYFYTANLYYTFSNLSSGKYTFYFQTMCGGEVSGFIGTVDETMY